MLSPDQHTQAAVRSVRSGRVTHDVEVGEDVALRVLPVGVLDIRCHHHQQLQVGGVRDGGGPAPAPLTRRRWGRESVLPGRSRR